MLLEILKHILTQPDGHLILFGIVKRVVLKTPPWVYALFIALVGFGLSQTRARAVHERVLAILPVAMTAYSFYGMTLAFGLSATSIAAWIGGFAAALGIGLALKRPQGTRYLPVASRFELPGSWTPLALILMAFFARYFLAVAMGIDPSLRQAAGFMVAASFAYGLLGGVFPARAARVWTHRFAH
jgi:hypothetical protein